MSDTAPATSAAGGVALADRVSDTLRGATGILRAYRLADVADLAEAKAAAPQRRAVVVVGEVKRGKSSLVNALIGVPDATPVAVDITTSVSIAFVPATDAQPAGTAELRFPGHTEQVPIADLPDWVSVGGRHVADPHAESLPTRAIVPLNSEYLACSDIAVIDTPGTGGLDPAHARVAQATAAQASVLVLVADATAPLTAPEMDVLAGAASSVDSVIVVVTKTDKNLRRWQEIVAENRRLIRHHLGRDLPVLGVSSVRALAAAALPPGPQRDGAETASGLTALRSQIAERLALGALLPAANGLRTACEGLARVSERIATDIAINTDTAATLEELNARRERLQELKNHAAQWELHLGRDLTLLRQDALAFLDERLDRVREESTERINRSGMTVLRRNPQVFTADIETALLSAMADTVANFLGDLRRICEPLFDSPAVWEEIEQSVVTALAPRSLASPKVASKRRGIIDPTVLTMGMMGTSMLGALFGVGAIAGVVWVGVNLGYRAMRTGKNNLLTWLRETVALARTTTARILETALSTARPEIVIRQREHLRAATERVQQQIVDAKEAARLDAETRKATLTKLGNNQRIVTQRSIEIDALLTEISAGVPAG